MLEAREAFRALHSDSLDQPRGARDDEDAGSLLDTLGDADLELVRAHDRAALDAVLDTLDERDRTIIRLYYKDELTQAEIGRRTAATPRCTSRGCCARPSEASCELTATQQTRQRGCSAADLRRFPR